MMRPPDIDAAPSDPALSALAVLLDQERCPLLLAPTHADGWFDGMPIAAWDPSMREPDSDRAHAAERLEASFAGDGPPLTAALLGYDGTASVLSYDGFLTRAGATWESTGGIDTDPVDGGEPAPFEPDELADAPLVIDLAAGMGGAEYRSAVASIQESIRAGDVYLVNLTYRLHGSPTAAPGVAFARLLGRSGAMMSAYVSDGVRAMASVSPERFVRIERDSRRARAEIWPIKGTRPRGATLAEDEALASELLGSTKERSEHVMVVDLERNDLGRVSQPGSIVVDPLLDVMPTPYCHQMYSTVHGRLRDDVSLAEVLEATFPCGSVTGTPKLAAMGVIDAIEGSPRGLYTGALVVAMRGRLDSSVLIRSLVDDGENASWGTGGGITIDSDAHEEWLESVLKAGPVVGSEIAAAAVRADGWG
jgi:anthranilate/para-aminobenzoate synthase component I